MRITINSFGTRGDVQPYLALGRGLLSAGHSVRVLSHEIHRDFVECYGFDFQAIPLDPKQVMIDHAFADMGNDLRKIMPFLRESFSGYLDLLFEVTDQAAAGAELLLNSSLSIAGYHVAEKRKIPALAAYLQPVTPTRYFHAMSVPPAPGWLPAKSIYNYASHKLMNQMFFRMLLSVTNKSREDVLGLPPVPASYYRSIDTDDDLPILYAYSEYVLPKPPDWSENLHVTGYWILHEEQDFEPDESLRAFLETDPKPVYIGFGSMVDHEREKITRLIVEALEISGCRAILLGGWSDLGGEDLPDSVLTIDYAPHEWLFPRCAAVMHHGGAGTTAAGLRAGVPTVVVPFFADQFFWGWRVEQLGVGSEAIRREDLSPTRLARALRQAIEDSSMRERAAVLGTKLRAEDGVGHAVRALEKIMQDPPYIRSP